MRIVFQFRSIQMKIIKILTIFAALFAVSCGWQSDTQTGGQSVFAVQTKAEKPKTVRAYAPEMNNMEMLSMTQMPGWRILAGTEWIGNSYCVSVRGVNDDLNAGMFWDGARNYTQSPMGKSGTSDGKTVYLNYMSAPDYLDYVFHRQFPNVKGARRVTLKTIDQYPEEERGKMENYRKQLFNTTVQGYRQMPGGENAIVRKTTVDCAGTEYQWVQDDGESIVHGMEVVVAATYVDRRSRYLNQSSIEWQQVALNTATFPAKNRERVEADFKQMRASAKTNDAYIAALNNIIMQGMRREGEIQSNLQAQMTQAEIQHQNRMTKMMQETNTKIANVQREAIANRQAAQDRSFRTWTDAIIGVNRFLDKEGNVVQMPVTAGSHAWENADGSTIITSDSYLFRPVENLVDRDGFLREFREMQLLR